MSLSIDEVQLLLESFVSLDENQEEYQELSYAMCYVWSVERHLSMCIKISKEDTPKDTNLQYILYSA